MGKAICFTGHRQIAMSEVHTLLEKLRRILRTAITEGFSEFYCGGAVGWDTYCGMVVLELREQYPDIHLHLVLPCPPEEQVMYYTELQKRLYYQVYERADSRVIISMVHHKNCMRERNQRLVDAADCCICYFRQNAARTGTGQTVRMAKKKGIPVANLSTKEITWE